MIDPKPPYMIFEDNGDETIKITLNMEGKFSPPEGMEWPQEFIFPMSFDGLADNLLPPEAMAEVQQEFIEKVIHIPDGV